MNKLTLVKAEHFGEIEADIYSNGKEMFMTIGQLAACLGYAGRDAIEKIVKRNPYLTEEQFSVTDRLSATDGKQYETLIFTEDGIYEVTMLSKQPKAREFRAWIRGILKALRRGEVKIVSMTDYQRMMAETRMQNVRIRKAQILERLAEEYQGTYRQVLQAHATKELTGEFLLPLPEIKERTYSATEIGEMLGISSNKVGILTNRHNLKTDEYGAWYNDKAKGIAKEVPTFRYYEKVVPVLRSILNGETA
ncbi:BRO-N domain-containing protein [Agathobaculum sp. LCP25S3_E8]|uniref:BRO-N domain-containing protein n=1 Tax=Agathobaculum sp. LCP25S3_E8 TaxID=3438735 RepID=UPI003F938F32